MSLRSILLSAAAVLALSGSRDADAAYEGRTHEIGGHDIAYVDQGSGPAIVLIHGLGADLSRWREVVGPLSKSRRVITLDLLGFGRSAKPNIAYRGQTFVDQVFGLLDALEIERATLVGNSMGGWIALMAAEQRPDRVERLVLVAPAFVQGLPDSLNADRLAAGAAPQTEDEMRAYLARVYASPPTDAATVQRLLREHRAANSGGAISGISRSLAGGEDTFTTERLERLSIKTLIVHGDADGVVPLAASEALAGRLPNAHLVPIANAGHWPQLEVPAAFLSVLLDALGDGEG